MIGDVGQQYMSDFDTLMEGMGLHFRHGPPTPAYREAGDLDDLHIAAGKFVALHAVWIMETLPLPRHGSVMLRFMRRVNPQALQEYWRINHKVFFEASLYDLCLVRDFFRAAGRWPELEASLKQIFIMATAYIAHELKLDTDETEIIRESGVSLMIDFEDDTERTSEQQLSRILEVAGIDRDRIRLVEFLERTVKRGTILEPFFFLEEYDRINK